LENDRGLEFVTLPSLIVIPRYPQYMVSLPMI
jgi:hypothetical protein